MERPLPPEVAKQVPAGVREAYEIKPGRQRIKLHNPGSFVPGVCYLIAWRLLFDRKGRHAHQG
jgi:hypothetical protein